MRRYCTPFLITAAAFLSLTFSDELIEKLSAPFSFPTQVGVRRLSLAGKGHFFQYTSLAAAQRVAFSWYLPAQLGRGEITVFALSGAVVKRIPVSGTNATVYWETGQQRVGPGVYIARLSWGQARKNVRIYLVR